VFSVASSDNRQNDRVYAPRDTRKRSIAAQSFWRKTYTRRRVLCPSVSLVDILTGEGAACDAASVHFHTTIRRTDIFVINEWHMAELIITCMSQICLENTFRNGLFIICWWYFISSFTRVSNTRTALRPTSVATGRISTLRAYDAVSTYRIENHPEMCSAKFKT